MKNLFHLKILCVNNSIFVPAKENKLYKKLNQIKYLNRQIKAFFNKNKKETSWVLSMSEKS